MDRSDLLNIIIFAARKPAHLPFFSKAVGGRHVQASSNARDSGPTSTDAVPLEPATQLSLKQRFLGV
jgi:hypothetical protein